MQVLLIVPLALWEKRQPPRSYPKNAQISQETLRKLVTTGILTTEMGAALTAKKNQATYELTKAPGTGRIDTIVAMDSEHPPNNAMMEIPHPAMAAALHEP